MLSLKKDMNLYEVSEDEVPGFEPVEVYLTVSPKDCLMVSPRQALWFPLVKSLKYPA